MYKIKIKTEAATKTQRAQRNTKSFLLFVDGGACYTLLRICGGRFTPLGPDTNITGLIKSGKLAPPRRKHCVPHRVAQYAPRLWESRIKCGIKSGRLTRSQRNCMIVRPREAGASPKKKGASPKKKGASPKKKGASPREERGKQILF